MSKRRFPLKEFPELLKNPPPNLDIMLYDKNKNGSTPHSGDNIVKKPTLSQRMNQLENSINKLVEKMDARFDSIEKRLDNVNARLDYVISANNLKDLPQNKKI